jgi:predicted 2-oxoglutarate/Fe(II)-dependent dioxygenase YbiX
MFKRHDFIPDFVLPDRNGGLFRFYGSAGGSTRLLALVPDLDHGPWNIHFKELMSRAVAAGVPVTVIVGRVPQVDLGEADVYIDQGDKLRSRWQVDDGPRLFLLNENLRVLHAFDAESPALWLGAFDEYLDDGGQGSAQALIPAPVLLIPNALDHTYCDHLVSIWETQGNRETGIELSADGRRVEKTQSLFKRRRDHTVDNAELMGDITRRVTRRLASEVNKAFAFRSTHYEGFKIVRYDGETGGFFARHRDNLSPSTAHRRFALSLNLNDDYDGGELCFPEYGGGKYRPEKGGAIIFSGSLLHEALPVTRGHRFVLISFLYRAEDRRRPRSKARD